ncbi:serine/threonine protein kinase [Coccidioides immitis RS]|uniref:Serine/threonine protein kinase n=1 Tax=Coccidioides immitis (strain RS) TaxID=246410 RepID=A0A0D8JUX6_COCIM|nr:serine/threonine protein kinase [Coccidioides immitis RS]KJF60726.1 serine/threonine protein kinase [Coccidioides immitis RS]
MENQQSTSERYLASKPVGLKRESPGMSLNERPKLRRMIGVNRQPSFMSQNMAIAIKTKIGNPWERYEKFLEVEDFVPGTLVHSKDGNFTERIVDVVKVHNEAWLSRLTSACHENIVSLHEAIYQNSTIFLFSEVMDVSLAQIFGSPRGRLQHYEVAAFCKEILKGLHYIHSEHKFAHGTLKAENILLSAGTAAVKIGKRTVGIFCTFTYPEVAGIGGSMLGRLGIGAAQRDLCALGLMITECLEPRTALNQGEVLVSEEWDSVLRDFQMQTQTKSAAALLQHDFIQRSPGPKCLVPYIRLARETTLKKVKVLT